MPRRHPRARVRSDVVTEADRDTEVSHKDQTMEESPAETTTTAGTEQTVSETSPVPISKETSTSHDTEGMTPQQHTAYEAKHGHEEEQEQQHKQKQEQQQEQQQEQEETTPSSRQTIDTHAQAVDVVEVMIERKKKPFYLSRTLWYGIGIVMIPIMLALTAPYLISQLPTDMQIPSMSQLHMPKLHIPEWITQITTTSTPETTAPSIAETPPHTPPEAILFPIPVPVPVPVPVPAKPTSPSDSIHTPVTIPVPLNSLLAAFDRFLALTPGQRELLETRPDLITSDLLPPLSNDRVGRAVWSFLHTVASIYPNEPTTKEQLQAITLIESIASTYPCPSCHENFQNYVATHPPDVSSKTAFAVWLCKAHNYINQKIGHPTVDCNPNHLALLWPDHISKGTRVPVPPATTTTK